MHPPDLKIWKQTIALRGIERTANDLGVSKEIVRLWVKKTNTPAGENLKNLVALLRGELVTADFSAFVGSLARDIFGTELPAPETRRAVNE